MKIDNSSLNLQSQHHYTEVYERRESITIEAKRPEHTAGDRLELSKENGKVPPKRVGLHDYGRRPNKEGAPAEALTKDDVFDGVSLSDMKTRIMKMVLEEITGTKIAVYNPDEENENGEEGSDELQKVAAEGEAAPQEMLEVTFNYELSEIYYERESLSFEATGQVTTEDGREISFTTSLHQSRELYEENRTSLTVEGTLVDPLVINHDGRGAKLTNDKVDFDLTADGTAESISNLQAGSSFLALDRNGNGTIDDGSELFGPTSGNGYAELRELDSDQNGWIDENDELFYDLKLWKPGEEASTLLERSVGAISLSAVGGGFQLRNEEQQTLGAIREQGIWLNEQTGQAGMVQEIDLLA